VNPPTKVAGSAAITWHRFRITLEELRVEDREITDWCINNLKGKWTYSIPAYDKIQVFSIKEKSDAMLFKLTWSQDTFRYRFKSN